MRGAAGERLGRCSQTPPETGGFWIFHSIKKLFLRLEGFQKAIEKPSGRLKREIPKSSEE